MCNEVREAGERYSDQFPMEVIHSKQELITRFEQIIQEGKVECFLINACPYIIPESLIQRFDFYNIHPGSLHNNRGHQPHSWSVLLDEKETKIVLYKISAGIDEGKVVAEKNIEVMPQDDEGTLLNRTESYIPELLARLYDHIETNTPFLYLAYNGEYRVNMVREDYCFHLGMEPFEMLDRKIRSRKLHSGACIYDEKGKRWIYVNEILSKEYNAENIVSLKQQEEFLLLYQNQEMVKCHISKIVQDYDLK